MVTVVTIPQQQAEAKGCPVGTPAGNASKTRCVHPQGKRIAHIHTHRNNNTQTTTSPIFLAFLLSSHQIGQLAFLLLIQIQYNFEHFNLSVTNFLCVCNVFCCCHFSLSFAFTSVHEIAPSSSKTIKMILTQLGRLTTNLQLFEDSLGGCKVRKNQRY